MDYSTRNGHLPPPLSLLFVLAPVYVILICPLLCARCRGDNGGDCVEYSNQRADCESPGDFAASPRSPRCLSLPSPLLSSPLVPPTIVSAIPQRNEPFRRARIPFRLLSHPPYDTRSSFSPAFSLPFGLRTFRPRLNDFLEIHLRRVYRYTLLELIESREGRQVLSYLGENAPSRERERALTLSVIIFNYYNFPQIFFARFWKFFLRVQRYGST